MSLSRRHFFLGSLAIPALAAKKPAPQRPNILLLLADNVPALALGVYGSKEIRTPNLDRLALTGTRFRKHFTAAPAPEPGRASLVTGRTPMQRPGWTGFWRRRVSLVTPRMRLAEFNSWMAKAAASRSS